MEAKRLFKNLYGNISAENGLRLAAYEVEKFAYERGSVHTFSEACILLIASDICDIYTHIPREKRDVVYY